ncbi:Zinc finger C2H2 [Penicillium malachiteum]|uniref:Zinc finger C2H2 n=1 Tax=Penicillium malachiteum TaxID=1324776 RepID=UPI00254970CF|nr:Zinc finger C2H2 [Penicillium malachiteum]KAJ5728620.1 Zinc finger C2H2 [Penicillium malachiteum]
MPELQPQHEDPYLSVSSDPEELDFQAGAIRLTPVGGSPNYPSSSPNGEYETMSAGLTIQTNYWTPQGNGYQDLSTSNSPHPSGFLAPSDIELRGSNWQDNGSTSSYNEVATPSVQDQVWPSSIDTTQWLNPEQSIPSPSSMQEQFMPQNNVNTLSAAPSYGITQLSISTAHVPGDNFSSASTTRGRSPVKSPIGITVSSVSRGDSPMEGVHCRRPCRSTMHLSPGDLSSDSGDDGHLDDDHRSVSSLSVARTNNGRWIRSPSGHAGLGPSSRGDEYVSSPNELKGQREREIKDQDITLWRADVNAASSEAGDVEAPKYPRERKHTSNRMRAKSTGARPYEEEDYFSQKMGGRHLAPGPGLLVHESEEEEDEDEDEHEEEHEEEEEDYRDDNSVKSGSLKVASPPADPADPGRYDRSTPEVYSALELTSPAQKFRLWPWQDPIKDLTPRSEAMQPGSSNAAIIAFEKRAKDVETASLAATIDNNSIIHVMSNLERMSLCSETKPKDTFGTLWKRSIHQASSKLKRQASEFSMAIPDTSASRTSVEAPLQRKESQSHRHRYSLSKHHSRSPSLSSALMSVTGQMAAIGGNNAVHAVSPNADVAHNGYQTKTRGRSKSDLPRPATPGLIDLMTNHGGPPVANFRSSPRNSTETAQPRPSIAINGDLKCAKVEDEDDDQLNTADAKGLVMDFPMMSRLPVPTLEGFKAQILQLNPNLQPALIHRFANAQVRRYRKLVELQQRHAQAIASGECPSGHFCVSLGGKATMLEQRKPLLCTEAGQTQFRVTDGSRRDKQSMGDSPFPSANFPEGVPNPPVARLPAKFECLICFDVKEYKKPSDWSKHVQEDLQPFTCTFPECNETKSFKRKADWVRHENELHRHLEWWTCTFDECGHTCYRKDNFMQHLVREHKIPEPKMKKGRGGAAAATSEGQQSDRQRARDLEYLSKLVDDCRHETEREAESEPCRFCGNILGNWKKLTVHLGKHMEQMAIPVLELAKKSTATATASSSSVPLTGASSGAAETYSPLSAPFHLHDDREAAGASTLPVRQNPSKAQANGTPVNGIPYQASNLDYPSISGAMLSSEPEAMTDSYDRVQYNQNNNPGYNDGMVQFQSTALHPDQTHLPHHQNSVTYPPPFNAVHRPISSYSQLHDQYPAQGSYPGYLVPGANVYTQFTKYAPM